MQNIEAQKSGCKNIIEDGIEKRIYVGEKNTTSRGTGERPCLKWTEVEHEFGGYPEVGDHNFCRNPGNDRPRGEWCYITTEKKRYYCGVRTCGRKERALLRKS